ncbi:MAG: hypothetical protein M1399_06315 [Actinobacteria bacterium]|nr:hypothetical protein [Actinomycetota bacterium]MCL5446209.1 hypothetical protein [Actinomycetota bacterium]
MIEYLSIGDYLSIAELILGIDGEMLAKGAGIGLAESALAAPQATFGSAACIRIRVPEWLRQLWGPPHMAVVA